MILAVIVSLIVRLCSLVGCRKKKKKNDPKVLELEKEMATHSSLLA